MNKTCSHGTDRLNCATCGDCVYCIMEHWDGSSNCVMCNMLGPSASMLMKTLKEHGIKTEDIVDKVNKKIEERKNTEEVKIDRSQLN